MKCLVPILSAGLALSVALPARAAGALADPTRPPPGHAAAGEVPPEPPLVVGSVFLSGRQAYALVDGREVRVGDSLGEGRVARIDERGVWIRLPRGLRLLPLLPAVRKSPARGEVEQR